MSHHHHHLHHLWQHHLWHHHHHLHHLWYHHLWQLGRRYHHHHDHVLAALACRHLSRLSHSRRHHSRRHPPAPRPPRQPHHHVRPVGCRKTFNSKMHPIICSGSQRVCTNKMWILRIFLTNRMSCIALGAIFTHRNYAKKNVRTKMT